MESKIIKSNHPQKGVNGLPNGFKDNVSAKRKKIAALTFIYIGMSVLALIFAIPVIYMLLRSFMSGGQVMKRPIEMFPSPFYFKAYVQIFVEYGYLRYLGRTVLIVVFNLVAVTLSASFVAYGFSRCKFFGKKAIFALMMGTMMLPGIVTQVPLYILFDEFHWTETILPLTMPNLFGGGAMYIFLIRQYMVGLPKEIEEAAKIDGANPFVRYAVITLPLCVPILVFILVSVFNANWSDYYQPLMYCNTKPTLALAVYNDTSSSSGRLIAANTENLKMAIGVFMSILPMVFFVVFQKQLIEGVSTSALKG